MNMGEYDVDSMLTPPPIVLIGAHRSGTSWMGDVLASAPGMVYWVEPRPVWMMGDPRRDDDAIPAERATDEVRRRIRRAFERRVRSAGGGRLCEKTPSNCLRVSFVARVLPEAKFIFVVRDARSVLLSSDRIRGEAIHRDRLLSRLREVPPWQWPQYSGAAINAVRSRLFGYRPPWWGPKPPGWRDMIGAPIGAQLGWQWAETVGAALDAVDALPTASVFRWRYEDMMARPRETMSALVDFCEIEGGDQLVARVEGEADPSRQSKWRDRLDPDTLRDARPYIAPLMERLGYDLDDE